MDIKFGVYTPLAPYSRVVKTAMLAEKFGFDSVWMGDHVLLPFTPPDCLDVWTTFGAIAAQTNRIKLGIGVTDPVRKHPAILAQTASTLDIVSNGRMIMGIGGGEAMNTEPYGINWEKPVGRMRETMEIVKKLWREDGVNYDGKFYKLRSAYMRPKPVQKPHPPIWVGANSRLGLKVTAELGDGWIPSRTAPETLSRDLKTIREYAEKIGRNANEIVVAPHTFTSISLDRDAAREAVARARLYLLFTPRRAEQLGYAMPTHEFDFSHLIYSPDIEKKIKEKMHDVPVEAAEAVSIWGTPDDCIEKIESYIEAGATYFPLMLLQNVGYWGPSEKEMEDAIELIGTRVLPYFREKNTSTHRAAH